MFTKDNSVDLCCYLFFEERKKKMKEKIIVKNNGIIVKMPAEIDHHTADEIRKEVDYKIEFDCVSNVVFDFSGTQFMDSSGIGLILGRMKMVGYLGGNVSVINVSENIFRIMNMAGITNLVTIKQQNNV